jgi:transcriptional regulator GlxA family with amidase domain
MLPSVRNIVQYVGSNLDQDLTLNKLARLVSLSPSRMCYLFKEEMGVSPGEYIKDLRLEKAGELLETTSLSVKEIRIRVGMSDQSHFARCFKRVYGVTPCEYRAKAVHADVFSRGGKQEADQKTGTSAIKQ